MFVLTRLLHQGDWDNLWKKYFPPVTKKSIYSKYVLSIHHTLNYGEINYVIYDCKYSNLNDSPIRIYGYGSTDRPYLKILIGKSDFINNFVKPYNMSKSAMASTIGVHVPGSIALQKNTIINSQTALNKFGSSFAEGTAYFTTYLNCSVTQAAVSYCDPNYNGGSTIYNHCENGFKFTLSNITSNCALHQAGYQILSRNIIGEISFLILKNNTSMSNNVCSHKGNISIKNSVFTRNNMIGGKAIIEVNEDKFGKMKNSSITISNCLITNNNGWTSIKNSHNGSTVFVSDSIVDSQISGTVRTESIRENGEIKIGEKIYNILTKPTDLLEIFYKKKVVVKKAMI